MPDVAARELRNDVSAVLRRVEAGERLRVTVSGRPVAELVPLPRREQTMSWEQFSTHLAGAQADAGLTAELADLLPDTTEAARTRLSLFPLTGPSHPHGLHCASHCARREDACHSTIHG